jgi:transcriptional regulator with XRE-family HTH domain
MAKRRGIPSEPPLWYLREWMAVTGPNAGKGGLKQSELIAITDWSKATMSQLYNGSQDLNSKYLREAAEALGVKPFELLMPPEQAFAIRSFRKEALRVVETGKPLDGDDKRTGTAG